MNIYKIFLSVLLFSACTILCRANIPSVDSAFVHLSTNPDSLVISGIIANLQIERVEVISTGDSDNTQRVEIYFGGCETMLIYKTYQTSVELQATFPYNLKIYTYLDTTSTCTNLTEPRLSDSLHLTAEQIISTEERMADDSELNIYPNPSKGIFHLDFPDDLRNASAILISPDGKKIKNLDLSENLFSLEDYPKGIYYLRIETAKGVLTRKIIIE